MLRQMRENTKVVLWIVVAAFVGLIFAVWGMDLQAPQGKNGQANVIGKVNGRSLQARDYQKIFSEELSAFRGQTDIPVFPGVSRLLEERTWERMVNTAIISKALEEANIFISDEEIVYAIRTNPPDFLRQNEAFLTDGLFDYEKYRAAVNDPTLDWRGLEQYFRSQLPMDRLRQMMGVSARVTEGELRRLYVKTNESIDFSYIAFLPREFEKVRVDVSDDELQQYWEEHQEDFRLPERSELAYVMMAVEPSDPDRLFLQNRMEEILQRIDEGTPFEDLARYYSEGPTAEQGGDIGTFKRGQMEPELEKYAFALATDEVSGVISADNHCQIIQVVERTGSGKNESVHLRQIFLNLESGGETLENIRKEVEAICADAKETSLDQAAGSRDLKVVRTGLFEEGNLVPTIGSFRAGNLFAFTAEEGDVCDPLYHNDQYYLISLVHRDSSHIEPLANVIQPVRDAVELEKHLALAKKEADGIDAGASLQSIARGSGRSVKEAALITRASQVPGVGADMRLIVAAFAAAPDQTTGPVHTEFGSFFLTPKKITPVDEERYQQERQYLLHSLLAQRRETAFGEWLQEKRDAAVIEDLRPEEPELSEG